MDLGIKDRVALVTASSQGLGFATAMRLSMEGAKVAICGRDENRIAKARDRIKGETGEEVLPFTADVTDRAMVSSMISEIVKNWGKIDILVCNAGGPPAGMHDDFTIDDFQDAIELNLKSTINLCYEVLPSMKNGGWGRIINITSISAKQPIDNLILSNTARAGLHGFAKSLSNQVALHGITVNCICPGYTMTERVEGLARKFASDGKGAEQDFYAKIESSIPAGRIGTPEEFAMAVAFLASEGAGYITGVSLQVDGGFTKGII